MNFLVTIHTYMYNLAYLTDGVIVYALGSNSGWIPGRVNLKTMKLVFAVSVTRT